MGKYVPKQKLDGGWRVLPPVAAAQLAPSSTTSGSGTGAVTSASGALASTSIVGGGGMAANAFPALPSAPSSSQGQGGSSTASAPGAAGASGGGKKGKAKKHSLQDFYTKTTVKTGNAWAKGPGALAQEERALLDAWGKR